MVCGCYWVDEWFECCDYFVVVDVYYVVECCEIVLVCDGVLVDVCVCDYDVWVVVCCDE